MSLTEKEIKENDLISGSVKLEKNELVYSSQGEELSRINIDEIKVLGEMTTQADAFNNDWFFVYVDTQNQFSYISSYANGFEDVLKELSQLYNTELTTKLFSSTTFDSNIIWPLELTDEKLFLFKEEKPINIFEKIGKFLGLGKPISPRLTERVLNHKGSDTVFEPNEIYSLKSIILNCLEIQEDEDMIEFVFAKTTNDDFNPESYAQILRLTEEEAELKLDEMSEKFCPGYDYFLELFIIKEMFEDIRDQEGYETNLAKVERIIEYKRNDA